MSVYGTISANKVSIQGHGVLGSNVTMFVQNDQFRMNLGNQTLLSVTTDDMANMNDSTVTDSKITFTKPVEFTNPVKFSSPISNSVTITNSLTTNSLTIGSSNILTLNDLQTTLEFNYGVASGDPTSNSMIFWTHAKYTNSMAPVTVQLQIIKQPPGSTNYPVGNIVASHQGGTLDIDLSKYFSSNLGEVPSGGVYYNLTTDVNSDFTVKYDATGLLPYQDYLYRFVDINNPLNYSSIGRTRTLAALGDNTCTSVKLAHGSCMSFSQGYFNVFREIAYRDDIDAVVFLGDWLYEYGDTEDYYRSVRSSYGNQISVNDYRRKYREVKTDPDIRFCMQRHPFIAVWDDHEFANDAYVDGAQNHSAYQGNWYQRKANAIKVYHEWMPIRPQGNTLPPLAIPGYTPKIYRSFQFGNLATLMMLDTRMEGRMEHLPDNLLYFPVNSRASSLGLNLSYSPDTPGYGAYYTGSLSGYFTSIGITNGTSNAAAVSQAVANYYFVNSNTRKIISDTQFNWVRDTAQNSVNNGTSWQVLGNQVLLAEEIFKIQSISTDSWAGYNYQRKAFVNMLTSISSNVIALTGDTHNAFYGKIKNTNNSNLCINEFEGSSVSSIGLWENDLRKYGVANIYDPEDFDATANASICAFSQDLVWMEGVHRGYALTTFTSTNCTNDFVLINTALTQKYAISKASRRVVINKDQPLSGTLSSMIPSPEIDTYRDHQILSWTPLDNLTVDGTLKVDTNMSVCGYKFSLDASSNLIVSYNNSSNVIMYRS